MTLALGTVAALWTLVALTAGGLCRAAALGDAQADRARREDRS